MRRIAMTNSRSHRKLVVMTVIIAGIAVAIVAVSHFIGWERIERKIRPSTTILTIDRSDGEAKFPDINTANLSQTRQKVIALARQEFAAQAPGTKYAEGVREPWCADFISWLFKEAGAPLKNLHTGGWRIPGTFTLREYYQQSGSFKPVDSGYTPRPGDVAIYRESPLFGDHINLVLDYRDGILTTVGGNENNRVRVFVNSERQYDGLLGYGVPG